MDRLVAYQPDGTHSAAWHLARVMRADYSPLDADEGDELDRQQMS
jgi:hypothetical protein